MAFTEAMNDGPERKMVRTEMFKYIYIPEMVAEKMNELTELGFTFEQRELYYLSDDPWENRNMVEENHEVVTAYQRLADAFIVAGKQDSTDTDNILVLEEDEIEKLRNLGYIK